MHAHTICEQLDIKICMLMALGDSSLSQLLICEQV